MSIHHTKQFRMTAPKRAPRRPRKARSRRHAPFTGKVIVGPHSSLRKLMRAAARGLVPPERAQVIGQAMANADRRYDAYLNSCRKAGL